MILYIKMVHDVIHKVFLGEVETLERLKPQWLNRVICAGALFSNRTLVKVSVFFVILTHSFCRLINLVLFHRSGPGWTTTTTTTTAATTTACLRGKWSSK